MFICCLGRRHLCEAKWVEGSLTLFSSGMLFRRIHIIGRKGDLELHASLRQVSCRDSAVVKGKQSAYKVKSDASAIVSGIFYLVIALKDPF